MNNSHRPGAGPDIPDVSNANIGPFQPGWLAEAATASAQNMQQEDAGASTLPQARVTSDPHFSRHRESDTLSPPVLDEEDPRLPVVTSVERDYSTTIMNGYHHSNPRVTAAEVAAARSVFVELAEHPDVLLYNHTDADQYVERVAQRFHAQATTVQLVDRFQRASITGAQSLRSATQLSDHLAAARRFRVGWWTNEVYDLFSLPSRLYQFISCSTFSDFVYDMSRIYVPYNHESLWLTPFHAECRGAAMYEAYRRPMFPHVIPPEGTHWDYDLHIFTFCVELPTAGLFVNSKNCTFLPADRDHLAQNILSFLTYNEVRFVFAIAYAYHAACGVDLHPTEAEGLLRFLVRHVQARRARHAAGDYAAAAALDHILRPGWCDNIAICDAFAGRSAILP